MRKHLQENTPHHGEKILLSHGDGGLLTSNLIKLLFIKHFTGERLKNQDDGAIFDTYAGQAVLATDSFVVKPLFFPGGDIGKLAVWGTVNDLAVMGASPGYMSTAFIIEEGLPISSLDKIAASMAEASRTSGIEIIAGDTKVVEKGEGGGLYINTTGFGILANANLGLNRLHPGDKILLNGSIGSHGLSVLLARENLLVQDPVKSDCASLHDIINGLLQNCPGVKFMRDLTRGGLATVAAEIAEETGMDIVLEEAMIPVEPKVKAASEMLGLDPFYLANEGKFIAVTAKQEAEKALAYMKKHPLGRNSAIIGQVQKGEGSAFLKTVYGGTRFLELMVGEPLPRIC